MSLQALARLDNYKNRNPISRDDRLPLVDTSYDDGQSLSRFQRLKRTLGGESVLGQELPAPAVATAIEAVSQAVEIVPVPETPVATTGTTHPPQAA